MEEEQADQGQAADRCSKREVDAVSGAETGSSMFCNIHATLPNTFVTQHMCRLCSCYSTLSASLKENSRPASLRPSVHQPNRLFIIKLTIISLLNTVNTSHSVGVVVLVQYLGGAVVHTAVYLEDICGFKPAHSARPDGPRRHRHR